jgi:hypothetical protein
MNESCFFPFGPMSMFARLTRKLLPKSSAVSDRALWALAQAARANDADAIEAIFAAANERQAKTLATATFFDENPGSGGNALVLAAAGGLSESQEPRALEFLLERCDAFSCDDRGLDALCWAARYPESSPRTLPILIPRVPAWSVSLMGAHSALGCALESAQGGMEPDLGAPARQWASFAGFWLLHDAVFSRIGELPLNSRLRLGLSLAAPFEEAVNRLAGNACFAAAPADQRSILAADLVAREFPLAETVEWAGGGAAFSLRLAGRPTPSAKALLRAAVAAWEARALRQAIGSKDPRASAGRESSAERSLSDSGAQSVAAAPRRL